MPDKEWRRGEGTGRHRIYEGVVNADGIFEIERPVCEVNQYHPYSGRIVNAILSVQNISTNGYQRAE